mmetsp:Transcript_49500/g.116685  ORF Transcript_49500/g.116685 Transcript_49500/m.116685 type:complete len:769 (-) Transcript_49500:226-2532(-)
MRTRDAGILLVSGLAIFLALESGTEYEVQQRWALELKPTLYRNGRFAAEDERLPKPIVDDLDGDGLNELIVATRDPKLKLLDPQHPVVGLHGAQHSGEMLLRMKAETTLLSKGVGNVRSGRQPVAMATGHIKPASSRGRHKVVVVLTHDWTVMCFDHHLKLLWESNPVKMKYSHAFHREASISITPTKLRPFDQGLVVVGASMQYEDHKRLHRKKPVKKKKEEEEKGEKRRSRNRIKRMLGLPIDDDDDAWVDDVDEYEDQLMHFNYFAFDGKRGALRWKHKAGDFLPISFDHEVTVPQHNYKLELHSEFKHAGEVDWRQYRSSMLHTLPHRWASKEDTRMYTSHFSKKARRDFDREKRDADAVHAREVGFFSSADPAKGAGKASRAGERGKRRRKDKSARRQAARDRKGTKAGDKAALPDAVEAKEMKMANVLVVHRLDGVEVLHLHTGRPLCELPLAKDALHADLNRDGAVDHAEAIIGEGFVTRPGGGGRDAGHRTNDIEVPQCWAWVTTGTPATHSLYNQSICTLDSAYRKMVRTLSNNAKGRASREAEAETKLHSVPPIAITQQPGRESADRNVHLMDAVFLVSDGVLSSHSPAGIQNWQLQTQAYWTQPALLRVERHEDSLMAGEDLVSSIEMQIAPALAPFKMHPHSHWEHILALGMHHGAIVSQDGDILAQFPLPDAPVAPPVIADFDDDGYNDVIIQTRTSLAGLTMKPTKHRRPLSVIMGGLLLLIGAVILVHLAASSDSNKSVAMRRRTANKGRATD